MGGRNAPGVIRYRLARRPRLRPQCPLPRAAAAALARGGAPRRATRLLPREPRGAARESRGAPRLADTAAAGRTRLPRGAAGAGVGAARGDTARRTRARDQLRADLRCALGTAARESRLLRFRARTA